MIIFDKIKKALFTEVEEEVYVEEEPQESELHKIEKEKVSQPRKPISKSEVKTEPVVMEAKPQQQTKSMSIDIKADVPEVDKKLEKRLKPIERKEIEIPQVISPISGVKGDEIKSVENYIPSAKARKNTLGTVISPYYGESELEEFEAQAQIDIANDKMVEKKEDFVDDEDIENVSLDQIVSTDTNDEDEMIQFSLFGDNTSLRDMQSEEDESPYEPSTKDDLPF